MVKTKAQKIFNSQRRVIAIELLLADATEGVKNFKTEQVDGLLLRQHIRNLKSIIEKFNLSFPSLNLHLNVCADTLLNGTIDGTLLSEINRLPFRSVYFEVLERGITRQKLEEIADFWEDVMSVFHKFRLALDDFGGGSASQEIIRPPLLFDCLKIDIEFFVGAENPIVIESEDKNLLHSIVNKIKVSNPATHVIVEKTTPEIFGGADGYQSFLLHYPDSLDNVLLEIAGRRVLT